jgi:hypothetical protein
VAASFGLEIQLKPPYLFRPGRTTITAREFMLSEGVGISNLTYEQEQCLYDFTLQGKPEYDYDEEDGQPEERKARVRVLDVDGSYILVENDRGGIETLCLLRACFLETLVVSKSRWYYITALDRGDSPEVWGDEAITEAPSPEGARSKPTRGLAGLGI